VIYLLDTHVLLWVAGDSHRLSASARALIDDPAHELAFSAASLWEIMIKQGLGREDFKVDGHRLRRMLLLHGYREIAVSGEHALAVSSLPDLHKDPFDRLLVAQTRVEGIHLLTHDATVAQYGDGITLI
jgi:PIN domain nuclease of toxin-antitoxin system